MFSGVSGLAEVELLTLTPLVELEVPVGLQLELRRYIRRNGSARERGLVILVGTTLQDFRDGRHRTLLDAGSVLSLVAGRGGSPTLALAPDLILEASELCPCQSGQPSDDLLYHPPPSVIVYADTMILHTGPGRSDPLPLDSQHGGE